MNSKAFFAKGRPATFFLLSLSPRLRISSISSYAIRSLDKPMTEWRCRQYSKAGFSFNPSYCKLKQQGKILALCFSIGTTLLWTKHWINSCTWDFKIPSGNEYAGEYLCNVRLPGIRRNFPWKLKTRSSPSVLSSLIPSPDRRSVKSSPNLS